MFIRIEEIIRECICNSHILRQINTLLLLQYNLNEFTFKKNSFLPIFTYAVSKCLEGHAVPEESMGFTGLGYN